MTKFLTRRTVLHSLATAPLLWGCGDGALVGHDESGGGGAGGAAAPEEPTSAAPPIVVAEGDSLTASAHSWAHLYGATNVATPGDRLGAMVDQAAVQVDPLFQPGMVATLWAGTNDLTIFDIDARWLFDKTRLWVSGRQEVGFRVIVFTMLPRLRWTTAKEDARLAYNELLQRELSRDAEVVDVCGAPGAPGDGVLYKTDGVHLMPEGQLWILDNRIRPALAA